MESPCAFAFSSASAICGIKWEADTRLMLCSPRLCCSRKISVSRSMDISAPKFSWLMSWFWQKTQRRLQWEKKTVPEPLVPLMGGSSIGGQKPVPLLAEYLRRRNQLCQIYGLRRSFWDKRCSAAKPVVCSDSCILAPFWWFCHVKPPEGGCTNRQAYFTMNHSSFL